MMAVIFNSDNTPDFNQKKRVLGLAGWLMNHSGGLIKNQTQANIVLLIIALTFFGLSIYILINSL